MSLIAFLIVIALTGLVVGALARLALPGPDPMSILDSTVIMYFIRRSRGGGLSSPGRDIPRRRLR
jgi:hypothetical protein